MAAPNKVAILILDNDPSSRETLRQMLDSEGWVVHFAASAAVVLPTLAKSEWTMVIANLAVTGITGPLFTTLKQLAQAPAMEDGKGRLRVMFLLPEKMGADAQRLLESEKLPYARRPYSLQDFLDKVSDLLIERGAIPQPIRQVRFQSSSSSRQGDLHQQPRHHDRGQGMFARQGDYSMTEEEIAEYEKQEQEEQARRKKKTTLNR